MERGDGACRSAEVITGIPGWTAKQSVISRPLTSKRNPRTIPLSRNGTTAGFSPSRIRKSPAARWSVVQALDNSCIKLGSVRCSASSNTSLGVISITSLQNNTCVITDILQVRSSLACASSMRKIYILIWLPEEKIGCNKGRRTRKYHYNFSEDKAQDIYAFTCSRPDVMLKTDFILSEVFSLRIKFDSVQSLV